MSNLVKKLANPQSEFHRAFTRGSPFSTAKTSVLVFGMIVGILAGVATLLYFFPPPGL